MTAHISHLNTMGSDKTMKFNKLRDILSKTFRLGACDGGTLQDILSEGHRQCMDDPQFHYLSAVALRRVAEEIDKGNEDGQV